MSENYDIATLTLVVNDWCHEHEVIPLSGQAAEALTERTVRFYRALGLLDAPERGGETGYNERHRLQLVAIRLLQAQGLPLRRIRQLLFGRSTDDLREIERRGLEELADVGSPPLRLHPSTDEVWRTTPLSDDFLIISRSGRALRPEQREQILRILLDREPLAHPRP